MYTNSQQGFTTSASGVALTSSNVAWPCGPRAKSYYEIRPQLQSFDLKYPNSSSVQLTRTNISWPHDIGMHKNWDLSKQGFDVTEEDWLIWFRPGATKDFFKLYAKIESNLPAGEYTFSFKNCK